MKGRLRPTSTMSPRRSTVTVTDGPSGTSASVVACSAGGGCPCARAVAATASMAVPLISARRPTTLGDMFCIMCLTAMFCRLPRWPIANGLLDLRDQRLCVAHDRLPFLLADGNDHHAVGSDTIDEDERAARAANVDVGQIRSIEHQVRIRGGARDAAVLVDAVAHRRQHVRQAGPRRRMLLAALEGPRYNC